MKIMQLSCTVILLVEFLLFSCQASRLTHFFALTGLYQILQTVYVVWIYLGCFASTFSLIGYLPFLLSFVRMWWRDSEARRLIFYR